MKMYDVYVEQSDLHDTETRGRVYQVVAKDLYEAMFQAGQRFNERDLWFTKKVKVASTDKTESYENDSVGEW